MLSGITICYLRTDFETLQRGNENADFGAARNLHQKDHIVKRSSDTADARLEALATWLSTLPDFAGSALEPASGDASFRRYFRVIRGGESWIVMDAPPPMEDCRPFIQVAAYLRAMSLNVPEILAADLDRGFLLMTDLGSRQYLDVLHDESSAAESMYEDAMNALLRMQQQGIRVQQELPPYDEDRLRTEVSLFRDWLCGRHLGIVFDRKEQKHWRTACDLLVESALQQPSVFVHRDYHSRNLMLSDTDSPGILDFQDAVEGPYTYDLASLLKDCYVRWPDHTIRSRAMRFYDKLDDQMAAAMDRDAFWRSFELMGVQRHLKASGIFARLLHRDGKAGYLPDVPRTLQYIVDAAPGYPALVYLGQLIEERCLPQLEAVS